MDRNLIRDLVADTMPRAWRLFEELVAIRSIASEPDGLARAAALVTDSLDKIGIPSKTVSAEGIPPIVFGHRPAGPCGPTVLLYSHYDVLGVEDPDAWDTPPWTATRKGNRLYGRGTADNKCGIVAMFAALAALEGNLDTGIKVIIEGSEETPDDGFVGFVRNHAELLAADVAIVLDALNVREGQPTLTATLRGLLVADVQVITMRSALHSGLYGGVAPDAHMALAGALASMSDAAGGCAIPGLVTDEADDLDPEIDLTPVELVGDEPLLDSDAAARAVAAAPSVTIIANDAPALEDAIGVIHPRASARVSVRLAPSQPPAVALRALTKHVEENAPANTRAEVKVQSMVSGFSTSVRGPTSQLALRCLREAYGDVPRVIGGGGAIPICGALAEALPGMQLVAWGAADSSSNVHGIDESVNIRDLHSCALATALFIDSLSREHAMKNSA